jgi:hypothetical protein
MKAHKSLVFAGATAICLAGSVARGDTLACATAAQPADWRSEWKGGEEFSRKSALDNLKEQQALVVYTDHPEKGVKAEVFKAIDCDAERLAAYYDNRTGRQQTFINVSSNLVLITATIAGLSSGAGSRTVGYWTGASFAPGVLAQFYTYEPTRDLFRTGAAMSAFLTKRHQEISRDIMSLRADVPAGLGSPPGQSSPTFVAECGALTSAAATVANWPDLDRAGVSPEVQRLQDACDSAAMAHIQLDSFSAAAVRAEIRATRTYAENVWGLDWQLHKADQEMQFTPAAAISQFLASPFLLVGSVLSRDDAKSAVATIKAQQAVATLSIDLPGLDLPEPPSAAAIPGQLAAQARGRLWAPPAPAAAASVPAAAIKAAADAKKLAADATDAAKQSSTTLADEKKSVRDALENARVALAQSVPEFNRRLAAAQRLAVVGRPGTLTAHFDTSTHSIQVVVLDAATQTSTSKPAPNQPAT